MDFCAMISIGYVWLDFHLGKGIYVFVHGKGQKCQKIKQNLVFG